ncbi:tissue alpha-l-fucosidase [Pyrenophora teres f. maculata]|nr:tissue alpha-l-fucosidase [Pyrenophora teres f. maculata]
MALRAGASPYANIRSLRSKPFLVLLWCLVHSMLIISTCSLELMYEGLQLVLDPKKSPGVTGGALSHLVDISRLRNNRAFSLFPRDADFDGNGASYPAQYLPPEKLSYGGLDFIFPQYEPSGGYDNVLAQGQVLNISEGNYIAVHILLAAENSVATGTVTAYYADRSSATSSLLAFPWWSWSSAFSPWHFAGDLVFPFHFTNTTINFNHSAIYRTVSWLDSTKKLTQLQLPNVTFGAANGPGGAKQNTRLHIFAVSLVPATISTGILLQVQLARSTNAWFEGTDVQIFEAIIINVGTEWVLPEHHVLVTIEDETANSKTVRPAHIKRLRPGDEARVRIGVITTGETEARTATPTISGTNMPSTHYAFDAHFGIKGYEPTDASIYSHESPPWFNDGKYGIFIHWGPYSVPAWGNAGDIESFAEWYWWWMNLGPNSTRERTYEYHLETYGPHVTFDDFIANFTASAYDPKEWVDLFADAGASYFVLSAKQHDGYALFDLPANISLRTSVVQVPHRNLVQELYEAADMYQPHLRKGAYYSLPEWFHPDYHGFGDWPGGNATNPYTNKKEPYLGYVPLTDYIADKVLPEMRILADMGTDLVWCDIGGPNLTKQFAAEYFNNARAQGRQVSINNRCGIEGDFDTATYATLQRNRKWERTASLDPFSYGYNRATPDDAYMKPHVIITRLIEAVSMNGNFLLNVGPTAEGIIPAIQQHNLRVAGAWIKSHAEAIFNTTFWSMASSDDANPDIRFTQTLDAFYIFAMTKPNATLSVHAPVPYRQGDNVTVVGGRQAGAVVPSILVDGVLRLDVGYEVREGDEFVWVFKIAF